MEATMTKPITNTTIAASLPQHRCSRRTSPSSNNSPSPQNFYVAFSDRFSPNSIASNHVQATPFRASDTITSSLNFPTTYPYKPATDLDSGPLYTQQTTPIQQSRQKKPTPLQNK